MANNNGKDVCAELNCSLGRNVRGYLALRVAACICVVFEFSILTCEWGIDIVEGVIARIKLEFHVMIQSSEVGHISYVAILGK
jgi:hypothetical protein